MVNISKISSGKHANSYRKYRCSNDPKSREAPKILNTKLKDTLIIGVCVLTGSHSDEETKEVYNKAKKVIRSGDKNLISR